MAKVKILTREELNELKKKKAQKRAKTWLVDSHGVCSHIPTNKALVPYIAPQKVVEEKEVKPKVKFWQEPFFLPLCGLLIWLGSDLAKWLLN